jgi:hypothetical protein
MVWALVLMLCVMVGICMHLLAARSGLQQRVADAQTVIAELWGAERTPGGVAKAHARLRMYCARWGMVITENNIVDKESQ